MRQGNISNGKGFLIPQYRLYSGAVFLSEEADLGWATVSGGARYEVRWQRVFEVDDVSINVPDETKTYGDVAAAFGISVPIGDLWSIGETAGRAWRAPNVNERYSQGVHHGTAQYEIGDADLGKERTWSVDGTLRHSGDRVTGQVAAYRNAISGFIYLEPRAPVLSIRGAYPGFDYAQTDAVVTGLEMSGEVRLLRGVEFTFSGALLRGTDDITNAPLYDMPADRGTLGLRFTLPDASWVSRPFLSAGLTLVREQDRVPEGTIYALPTDGYQLVDVELGAQSLQVNGRRINVGLEVRNLFDTSYRDYLSRYKLFVDDLGRDIVLRVRVPVGGAL